eukprot:TRINITY_DN4785_c0_g2_i3.p1 TRINITY_DN4785_c0_g2~~TRINITY_DN4785_c0_g2_i3.p1  ORF type:complete len:223 (+),score=37.27 TRINITY_DN4785_c0_g2_i3:81-749(+)
MLCMHKNGEALSLRHTIHLGGLAAVLDQSSASRPQSARGPVSSETSLMFRLVGSDNRMSYTCRARTSEDKAGWLECLQHTMAQFQSIRSLLDMGIVNDDGSVNHTTLDQKREELELEINRIEDEQQRLQTELHEATEQLFRYESIILTHQKWIRDRESRRLRCSYKKEQQIQALIGEVTSQKEGVETRVLNITENLSKMNEALAKAISTRDQWSQLLHGMFS